LVNSLLKEKRRFFILSISHNPIYTTNAPLKFLTGVSELVKKTDLNWLELRDKSVL